MIELKMSNGQYHTHEDLERYLNENEDFYNSRYLQGMLEFEWKDFVIENNNIIERTISEIQQIDLIIRDIKRVENYSPGGGTGHLKVNTGNRIFDIGVNLERLSVKLRGTEDIGVWKQWNENGGYGFYEDVEIKEVYVIEFEKININNPKTPPFKKGTDLKYSVPTISFFKLITEKPIGLKKGDKILFNLNITDRSRFKGKEEYIYINYVEKVNIISPIKIKPQSTNKNCFIVTTTMGDINHPVVVDFRRYRDKVLLNTYFGRVFINIYYRIGPVLSKGIKTNSFLFSISKKLVLRLHKRIM